MVAKAFAALYSKYSGIDMLLFVLFGFQSTVTEVFVIWENTNERDFICFFSCANDISVLLFILLVSYWVP